MILHKVKSKNSVSYYVIESFRKPNGGGTSSRVVEKLGTAVELKQRLGDGVDIEQWAHDYVAKLNASKKAKKPVPLKVSMTSGITYDMGEKRCFNAGYLMLQKILRCLDIKKMTKEIRTELITAPKLIKTLRNMNLTRFDKKKGFYTGAFTRTNITEAIHAFAGFRLDCDLLTESDLKNMIKLTKKP